RAVAPGAVCGASPPRPHRSDRGARPGGYRTTGGARRHAGCGGIRLGGRGLLFHQSNCPRVGRDGGMFRHRRRPRGAQRGRVGVMAEFWTNYLWPLIVMVAQSVLLLVILLII